MRHLEMIESAADATATANDEARMTMRSALARAKTPAADTAASTVLTKFEWVYTKSTGLWYSKVAPGDAVTEGEQIGRVGDLFGHTLEEIVSPVNGVVLFLTINPSVLENGLLMGIGAA
jgi:predicted deacylase